MDAVKYVKAKARMCKTETCLTCPLSWQTCGGLTEDYIEEAVVLVEKWDKEHPERTRQSVFLERYPNAPVEADGVLELHPCEIDKTIDHEACRTSCENCRKNYWLAPVEEEKK